MRPGAPCTGLGRCCGDLECRLPGAALWGLPRRGGGRRHRCDCWCVWRVRRRCCQRWHGGSVWRRSGSASYPGQVRQRALCRHHERAAGPPAGAVRPLRHPEPGGRAVLAVPRDPACAAGHPRVHVPSLRAAAPAAAVRDLLRRTINAPTKVPPSKTWRQRGVHLSRASRVSSRAAAGPVTAAECSPTSAARTRRHPQHMRLSHARVMAPKTAKTTVLRHR